MSWLDMTNLRHFWTFLVDCGSLRAQHFSLFDFLSCNANIFCSYSATLSHFLSCRFWEIQYFWEETTTQIYFRWWWKQTKTKWKTFFFALFRNSKSREESCTSFLHQVQQGAEFTQAQNFHFDRAFNKIRILHCSSSICMYYCQLKRLSP